MTKATKKAVFAWNDKNSQTIIDLYNESEQDNSKKNLDSIAAAVGAKSAASVRMKLTNLKAYVKVEATATEPSKTKVTKIEKVWTLEKTLGMEKDTLDGLSTGATMANLDELQKAVANLGSPESVKAAYSVVMEAESAAMDKAAQQELDSEALEVNELAAEHAAE